MLDVSSRPKEDTTYDEDGRYKLAKPVCAVDGLQQDQSFQITVPELLSLLHPIWGRPIGAMTLTERFESALLLATRLHAEQVRKGSGVPYVSHLLAVSSLVMEHGGDEDQAIAALLHDAVEDQGGLPTLKRIRDEFGDRVADIVDGCTDSHETPKPPWRQRKEAYIKSIPEKSPETRFVSCADKLHNARAILADYRKFGDEIWTRFKGKKEGMLWYLESCALAFSEQEKNGLSDELSRVVDELHGLTITHR